MPQTETLPAEAPSPNPLPTGEGVWLRAGIVIWAALCILLLFGFAMTRTVTYDEDQYIAAGVMTRHLLLPYRDFVYLQAPLYPFVLAPFLYLADGYALLAGRALTFVLAVVSGALLWRILRRLGADAVLTMVLLTACLASPFLASPLANTRNDALPLTLMLAGLLVFLAAEKTSWWGRAAAALLFGLAAEAKISYLFGPAMLGLHALFAPRARLPPFILGTALAAVPAALCFAAAPESFWFGVFGFHVAAPADWYGRQGLSDLLEAPSRLMALVEWLSLGGNLTLVVMASALSIVAMSRRRKWKRPGPLLLALTIGATALALVPSPAWAMYYAAVAPLLACCIAHLDRVTTHLADPLRKRILLLVAALPILPVLLLAVPEVARLGDTANWVGLAARQTALEIRAAAPGSGDVATLFPILVLDANKVRRDFASGPFVFRSGDVFPPAQLARLHALSPATLDAAFDRNPPAAIYAGLFPLAWRTPMDAALIHYAEQHQWRLVRTEPGGARLWLKP